MKTSNSAVITHVEINQNLLNTLFKFNPLSKLKRFLSDKTGVEKALYSLAEILTILKNIIRGEGMFDHANPSVIICSPELERALNMKALHVTEIRDLVLSQITKVPDQSLRENFTQEINCRGTTINISRTNLNLEAPRDNQPQQQSQQQPPRIIRTANSSTAIYTDKNAKFTLKPKFLKVVQLVPGADPKQRIFSYEDVTILLTKYILSRKDTMFDTRNIKLALIADDPLGDAFGVKAFHRCQVNNLLKKQLIPFDPNCHYNPPIVTSSSGPDKSADQCHLNSTTLTTASKLPTNPLNPSEEQRRTRKRNSAGDLTEQAGTELDSESYPSSQLCILCCQRPRDASFVHGDLGHMVSCFYCADRLWKRQATCPVCRRTVDRIIRIIES